MTTTNPGHKYSNMNLKTSFNNKICQTLKGARTSLHPAGGKIKEFQSQKVLKSLRVAKVWSARPKTPWFSKKHLHTSVSMKKKSSRIVT